MRNHGTIRTVFLIITLIFAAFKIHAANVMLDDFESTPLKKWGIWQPKKPHTFSLTRDEQNSKSGSASLHIDMRTGGGVVQFPLKGEKLFKSGATGLRMWMKAAKGNAQKKINVLVAENKGKEKYYIPVSIPDKWTQIEMPFAEFKTYAWGGAKVVDGIMDVKDLVSFKFGGYGTGAVFNIDALEVITDPSLIKVTQSEKPKKKEYATDNSGRKVIIEEVDMNDGPRRTRGEYSDTVKNVTIKGNTFLRDGKPAFFLGGWQLDNECHPWLLRALGIDLYIYNATEIYIQYAPQKEGNTIRVEKRAVPWYEAWIHRALSNNVMFWHEQKSGRHTALKKDFPDVYDAGHFVAFNPFDNLGRIFYEETYKAWMRYTKKYPIFCYELFNETGYANKHMSERREFRIRMKQKYIEIEHANKAWGTNFTSFDEADAPGFLKLATGAQLSTAAEVALERNQAKAYPNLWIDWIKFQESRFGEAVDYLMPTMRRHDPRASIPSTIQTHANLGWDYGHNGVYPGTVTRTTDFYTHEQGLTVCPQEERENIDQIKMMLRLNLSCDVVRNACQNKPVFNGESPLGVSSSAATAEQMSDECLVKLPGKWKFCDATEASPAGWQKNDFDDNNWTQVTVPAMWGKEGHPKCKTGIYRKTFTKPDIDKKIFLNGSNLCDSAEIHINGRLLYETIKWNEKFSIDITDHLRENNVLAIKIRNSYFKDGMYYGGIRGFISINNYPSKIERTVKPGYYRTHVWTQVAHGMSGDMVCYGSTQFRDAAKILAKTKKEIESVADIVLPRPRIKGRVAIVYPFETFRGNYHDSYKEFLSAPATKDFMNYYAPLLFSRVGVDVISNEDILKGKAGLYEMIVMAGNIRVPAGVQEKMERFVNSGGVLLADTGCMGIDDDSHEKIDPSHIFGLNLNEQNTEPPEAEKHITKRWIDGMTKINASLDGAIAMESRSDGQPLATSFNFGAGKTWYVTASVDYEKANEIISKAMSESGIKAKADLVDAKGNGLKFAELTMFENGDKAVALALNWGKPANALLKWQSATQGDFLVRNISSGNILRGPGKEMSWSGNDLAKGIGLKLENIDPVVLLIEPLDSDKTELKNISPKRHSILTKLWAKPKARPNAEIRIALTPEIDELTRNPLPNSYIPTAESLMRTIGCNVNEYKNSMDLGNIDVIVWSCPNFAVTQKDVDKIKMFVKDGGGLLLCGRAMTNWHTVIKKGKSRQLFTGFKTWMKSFTWLQTDDIADNEDLLRVHCTDFTRHPVSDNVGKFVTAFTGVIDCDMPKVKTLLKAPENCSQPGAPIMVEFPYGKGKVVIIGDAWWLKPFNLERGDNPQLFANLVRYLGNKELKKLSKKELQDALYLTRSSIEQAEQDEAEGKSTFAPLGIREETLKKWKRKAGVEDPITDMLE